MAYLERLAVEANIQWDPNDTEKFKRRCFYKKKELVLANGEKYL